MFSLWPRTRGQRIRFGGLIAVAALAGLWTWYQLYFWYAHPIGAGPTAIPVEFTRSDRPWSEQKVLLLGLGDSITAGLGSSPGMSYFDRLAVGSGKPEFDKGLFALADVLPRLESRNRALSGTTSIELETFSLPDIEVQPEDVFGIVVMTTGGNDVIHNYGRTPPREGAMYGATLEQAAPWIAAYRVRLRRILDEVESRFPGGCEIFLANIYDPTDGIGDIENAGLPAWPQGLAVLAAYNEVIADLCAERDRVHLVEIRTPFLGHGIHSRQFWRATYRSDDPGYWYWDNLEDPNDRGYDALTRLFLDRIAKVVPESL